VDHQQTLLGTIYFISLLFPFDATSDPLKAAIARWLKLRGRGDVVPPKGKAALDSTFVDEVRGLHPRRAQCLMFSCFFSLSSSFPWRAAVRATHSVATHTPPQCLRTLAPGYLEANESAFSLITQCSHIPFPDDFVADSAPIGLRASLRDHTHAHTHTPYAQY
jgi:hypothetical protein